MRMNLPIDRQGHLGDLKSKSIAELKELLERQENILSKSGFLQTLPDKGEKCRKFAEHLRFLISERGHPQTKPQEDLDQEMKFYNSQESSQQINVPSVLVSDVKERDVNCFDRTEATSSFDQKDITARLQNLNIGNQAEKQTKETYSTKNAYERIVKQVEGHPSHQKFMPNEALKPKLPIVPESKKQSRRVFEESTVKPPDYKFQGSKLISIDESIRLIDEHRAKNETLIAEHAAQRLAAQLVPKMPSFSGQGNMQYREPRLAEEGDSDDDDEEEDIDHKIQADDDDVEDVEIF